LEALITASTGENPDVSAELEAAHLGGQNAEAYFSFDGTKLIFQSTRPP
jgi:hypothetical protein